MLKQLRYFQSVVKNNGFSEDSCAAFRIQSNLALSTEPAPGTKEIFIRTPALAQACEMGKQI